VGINPVKTELILSATVTEGFVQDEHFTLEQTKYRRTIKLKINRTHIYISMEKELLINKPRIVVDNKPTIDVESVTSSADRYRKSWNRVYSDCSEWRRNEIDNDLKDGILEDNRWNDDFIQQVIALAESEVNL
jgi:hypothetical protein